MIGVLAIAGMPPMGIFMSEFLIVTSTMARNPWLAIPLVAGLLVGFGALLRLVNTVAFGEPLGRDATDNASYVPLFVHLAIVFDGRHLSAGRAGALVSNHRDSVGMNADA